MVVEIWSMTHNICHFGTFFCPFTPRQAENQNFQIIKKEPGDIIILQMCTINDNHEMCFLRYGV